MGTPIEPVIVTPGIECSTCWGIGKDFALPSPKYVTMSFYDWSEGPNWFEMYRAELSSPVVLEQSAIIPCFYGGVSANCDWWWELLPGGTYFGVKAKLPLIGWAMKADGLPTCQLEMQNQVAAPSVRITTGGYASILLGS